MAWFSNSATFAREYMSGLVKPVPVPDPMQEVSDEVLNAVIEQLRVRAAASLRTSEAHLRQPSEHADDIPARRVAVVRNRMRWSVYSGAANRLEQVQRGARLEGSPVITAGACAKEVLVVAQNLLVMYEESCALWDAQDMVLLTLYDTIDKAQGKPTPEDL